MTTQLTRKFALILFSLMLFSISCKKQELNSKQGEGPDTNGNLPISGLSETVIVFADHVKGTSVLIDSLGNPVDLHSGQIATLGKGQNQTYILTSCSDGSGNPILTFDAVYFSAYGKVVCDSSGGIVFSLTYNISTALPLVASSSVGTMRLRNSAGTVIKTYPSITTISLVTNGSDPSFPGDTKYIITYTCPQISVSDWHNAYVVDNSVTMHTTCTKPANIGTGYQAQYSLYVDSVMASPCTRIDIPRFDSTHVYGSDSTGRCNNLFTGYVAPTYNEIAWDSVSGGAISKLYDLDSHSSRFISTTAGTDDAYTIHIHHGTYKIRYRNKQGPLYGNCLGPWSAYSSNVTY